jgi:hypothetical protein
MGCIPGEVQPHAAVQGQGMHQQAPAREEGRGTPSAQRAAIDVANRGVKLSC